MAEIRNNTAAPVIELPGRNTGSQPETPPLEIELPGNADAATPVPDEFPVKSY